MKILIAEDDPLARTLLQDVLEDRGYSVVVAGDGEEAWRILTEESIEILVTDWMMPVLDGASLTRRIREVGHGHYVYVIMLTAREDEASLVAGLEAGADDFLSKPFRGEELCARLRVGVRTVELQKNLRLRNQALAEANRTMAIDLEAAARVQRAHFPVGPLRIQGWNFAWSFIPQAHASGDMLNVFRLDDHHVGLYLIDVSGHGVAAAMLSVSVSRFLTPVPGHQSLVKHRIPEAPHYRLIPPDEVLSALRRQFPHDERTGLFFTILYAVLDIRTGKLCWASAGHHPPALQRDGRPRLIESGSSGLAVGFPLPPPPNEATGELTIEPGDRLFLYSDGIVEALNAEGEEFAEDRFLAAIEESRESTLHDTLEHAVAAAAGFIEGVGFQDDVTLLAVELTSLPEPIEPRRRAERPDFMPAESDPRAR